MKLGRKLHLMKVPIFFIVHSLEKIRDVIKDQMKRAVRRRTKFLMWSMQRWFRCFNWLGETFKNICSVLLVFIFFEWMCHTYISRHHINNGVQHLKNKRYSVVVWFVRITEVWHTLVCRKSFISPVRITFVV